jgi:signal transduction histidine kinase/CheY-like chemotaxis protein/ligand-binding sensor domain-containing protein/HPt (histidine-containing phosphotransfer) domain-containing protein
MTTYKILSRFRFRRLTGWALWTVMAFGAYGQGYSLKNYNIKEGIAQSEVNDILEDRRGFLWVATEGGGVSVFDGMNFTNLNVSDGLKSNQVINLLEDSQGRIWTAHKEGGLTRLDGRSDTIFTSLAGKKLDRSMRLFEGIGGNFWVSSYEIGLFYTDGSKFTFCGPEMGLPCDSITGVSHFADGRYLIATELGLYRYDGRRFARYNNDSSRVLDLLITPNQHIWYLTLSGLWEIEPGSQTPRKRLSENKGFEKLHIDTKGRFWLAGDPGLARYENGQTIDFRDAEGFLGKTIRCIFEDSWGNMWFGLNGGGMTCYTDQPWFVVDNNTPLKGRGVFKIVEISPDTFWVGTDKGLFEIASDVVREVPDFPMSKEPVYGIYKGSDGKIDIAGPAGYCIYERGKFRQVKTGTEFDRLDLFTIDGGPDGDRYITSVSGAFIVIKDTPVALSNRFPVLGKPQFQVFLDSKHRRWHLNLYGGFTLVEDDKVTQLELPQNFSNNLTLEITEDRHGQIWIGTYSGLLAYKGDQSCYLTSSEGLVGDVIYVLVPTPDGNLWVGTEKGLNLLILDEKSDVLEIRTFGENEGFKGLETNQGSGLLDRQGRLWIGTVFGLYRYDPKGDIAPDRAPQLHITGLELDFEKPDWQAQGLETEPFSNLPIGLELPGQHHIRFSFQAASMWRAEKIRYMYWLEGLTDDWSKVSLENYAIYTSLPPGNYIFHVKAQDARGIDTEEQVFRFSIKAPFYKRFSFFVVSALAAFLILFLIFRLRLRNANRIRQRLERKVGERTEQLETANLIKSEFLAKMSHEIRTPMNGVIGMTELLGRTPLDDRQRKFVENIRVSGQNLLELINDILDFSRIEAGKIQLESLPTDLRGLIEEVLDILAYGAYRKGLELLVWIDPEIRGPIMADPSRIKQILLNLVGNAIKFTERGHITVTATLLKQDADKAQIKISVQDSGIGIPRAKIGGLFESFSQVDASTTRKYGGTGLGLAISYSLAQKMGGEMWVESTVGVGSSFHFSISAGLSAPWKLPEGAHPAMDIPHRQIAAALSDPAACDLLQRYLQHWGLTATLFDSLSSLTEALLEGQAMDFLIVDTRCFPTEVGLGNSARQLVQVCAQQQRQFAVFCEPGQEVDLQPALAQGGWLIAKPWKRADLLAALVGDKRFLAKSQIEVKDDHDLARRLPLDILIAEDNPINVEVATGILKNFGYVARVAEDGMEALDQIALQMPDLVLMDVQMPRMDGLTATRAIRARYGAGQPKIVAMTANAMESDRQACLAAGMDTFVSKPFSIPELLQILNWAGSETKQETPATDTVPPETTPLAHQAPPVDMNAAPLTDLSMLSASSGGDPAFVSAILGKLIAKMPDALREIQNAAAAEDWETVRAVSHRTKSSAAYTGAEPLRELLRDLEHIAGARERLDSIPERLVLLQDLVMRVVEELKAHLVNQ